MIGDLLPPPQVLKKNNVLPAVMNFFRRFERKAETREEEDPESRG